MGSLNGNNDLRSFNGWLVDQRGDFPFLQQISRVGLVEPFKLFRVVHGTVQPEAEFGGAEDNRHPVVEDGHRAVPSRDVI